MANTAGELVFDIDGVRVVYKDGVAERPNDSPFVPPSVEDPKTGVSSKDITISPQVSARLYLPKLKHPNQKLPIIVYYHGGGFCVDSAFNSLYHLYVNTLASQTNAIVVSVEYRRAPEHPLPAAYEDSWSALQWVASHSVVHETNNEKDPWLINHGDFDRAFIGGDSAGGNISHYLTMRVSTESLHGGVRILGAILLEPYFWSSNPIGAMSIQDNQKSICYRVWMFVYPSAPGGIDSPFINPMADNAPSLSGLSCGRLFVCTAEKDELRERGFQYVEAIEQSGWKGQVELVDYEGEAHCFQVYDPYSQNSKNLMTRLASFIMQ